MPDADITVVGGITRDEAIDFFRHFASAANHQRPRCTDNDGDLIGHWWLPIHGSISTCDFPDLTEAVFDAHDRGWRMEIRPYGPRHFRVDIWRRTRGADQSRCAPTLEEAVERWRRKQPASKVV